MNTGSDGVAAGDGDDTVFAGLGDDIVYGDAGDDVIYGGDGNDTLIGGEGNDTLDAGQGNDILDGGIGDDLFIFGNAVGDNIVNGFVDGEDLIDLAAFGVTFADLNIVDSAGDAVITIDGIDDFSITVDATAVALLTTTDFVF